MKIDGKYKVIVDSLVEELNKLYSSKYRPCVYAKKGNDVKFEYVIAESTDSELANKGDITYFINLDITEDSNNVGKVRIAYTGPKDEAYHSFYKYLLQYIIAVEDSEYIDNFNGKNIIKSFKTLYDGY